MGRNWGSQSSTDVPSALCCYRRVHIAAQVCKRRDPLIKTTFII